LLKVLNFGAGVQTTYMLLKYDYYDYVVFANTGDEHNDTYWYIEKYVKPFCIKEHIKFVEVQNDYNMSLFEYYYNKKEIPSIEIRDCTWKFKIYPIRRFDRYYLKAHFKRPVLHEVGFSWDENIRFLDQASKPRTDENGKKIKDGSVKYQLFHYPLICEQITREQCERGIEKFGWPVPPKSGCDVCPFSKLIDINLPKAIKLEKNHPRYPEFLLRGMSKYGTKPLELVTEDDIIHDSSDGCKTGYCFA